MNIAFFARQRDATGSFLRTERDDSLISTCNKVAVLIVFHNFVLRSEYFGECPLQVSRMER